jgi:transposase-like protein
VAKPIVTFFQSLYLYLDAIYPKVRSGGKVVSLPVLVALGVRENGEKVLLSLMTTGAESADMR